MKIRFIFWMEAVFTASGFVNAFLFPRSFLESLGIHDGTPATLEMARWFGALLPTIAVLEVWGLLKKDTAFLRMIFVGMLLGDIFLLYGQYSVSEIAGGWTKTLVLSVVTSTLFFGARVAALIKPSLVQKRTPEIGSASSR